MKSLLLFVLVFVSFSTWGQFSKGTYTIGGSASYTRYVDMPDDPVLKFTRVEFMLSPEYGLFVAKDFQVGIGLKYRHYKSSTENPVFSDTELSSYGGLFFTRYFYHNFFIEGQYNLTRTRVKSEFFPDLNKTSQSNFQVGLGRAFMISEQVAIEPKLFYQFISNEPSDLKGKRLNLAVGIRVYINRVES